MASYYVNDNAQPNGDHEVHKDGCQFMPKYKTSLGDHASCGPAVTQAKRKYPTANGCRTCSRDCHTG